MILSAMIMIITKLNLNQRAGEPGPIKGGIEMFVKFKSKVNGKMVTLRPVWMEKAIFGYSLVYKRRILLVPYDSFELIN